MINRVTLVGRLGKDPETKYLPSGDPVVNFSVATDEVWKDKDGKKVQRTEWHNVKAFKKLAEICGEYLTKGKLVYIEGKIQTSSWEDKEGKKQYRTEIIADTMKMLSGGDPKQEGHTSTKKESTDDTVPDPSNEDVPF
jgi:single-strand DNA-binding protein